MDSPPCRPRSNSLRVTSKYTITVTQPAASTFESPLLQSSPGSSRGSPQVSLTSSPITKFPAILRRPAELVGSCEKLPGDRLGGANWFGGEAKPPTVRLKSSLIKEYDFKASPASDQIIADSEGPMWVHLREARSRREAKPPLSRPKISLLKEEGLHDKAESRSELMTLQTRQVSRQTTLKLCRSNESSRTTASLNSSISSRGLFNRPEDLHQARCRSNEVKTINLLANRLKSPATLTNPEPLSAGTSREAIRIKLNKPYRVQDTTGLV
jgi:hypothetical protein